MQQQSADRRAWGARPPPKPNMERRAGAEPPAPAQPSAPAPQHYLGRQMSQHRSPGKVVLPKLCATASPRGAYAALQGHGWAAEQQQHGGAHSAVSRLKQHATSGESGHASAAAPPLPTPMPPPQAAAASPQSLPLAAVPSEAAWLQNKEEEDVVLIGSAAPSFSQPSLVRPSAAGPPAATTAVALPSTELAAASAAPGRVSFLTTHLSSNDLSLAVLASTSRRGSRYSSASASSSLPTCSDGELEHGKEPTAVEGLCPAAESYPPDFEAESPSGGNSSTHSLGVAQSQTGEPAAASQPPAGSVVLLADHQAARQAVRLSSGELAVLRESMLELHLLQGGGRAAADAGTPAAAAPLLAAASDGGLLEIPDQVVLQELSSRLSHLDSQKRRVLLEVLSKLDVMPGGKAGSAEDGAAEEQRGAAAVEQLIADSLATSHRASAAGSAGGTAPTSSGGVAGACACAGRDQSAFGSALRLLPAREEAPPPEPELEAAAVRLYDGEAPPNQAPAAAQSPSKGLLGKLAALRLGRTSGPMSKLGARRDSSGDGSNPQPPAVSAPGVPGAAEAPAAPPVGPDVAADGQTSPLQPTEQPLQPRNPGHKLQGMVRQRERSRLSLDGRHSMQAAPEGQQTGQAPLAAAGRCSASGGSGSGGAAADDTLSAFEQMRSDEEGQPSLASSPTVLALGAWQQLPDALDAATGQATGRSSVTAGGTSRGSGRGGGLLIPRCPAGQVLELRISSTWGDHHYVGLAGIEIFDSSGQLLSVRDPKRQVSATPHSINVLPEYGSDPRTPDKLLDGVCMTCDDAHVWLAPFTRGVLHTVAVTLDAPATLGAVRVWNYNKSRIHSLRGARHVELVLDGSVIFRGELCQAAGSVSEAYKHAELILFSDEPTALAAIEQYDVRYSRQLAASPAEGGGAIGSSDGGSGTAAQHLDLVTSSIPLAPPSTHGQLEHTSNVCLLPEGGLSAGRQQMVSDSRPLTAAFSVATEGAEPAAAAGANTTAGGPAGPRVAQLEQRTSAAGISRASTSGGPAAAASSLLHCQTLTLVILDTWGDSHFVGLSGLQVLGADSQPLPVAVGRVTADPPDLNVFPGHSGDVRTVDKLVDGTSNTMDDRHMWLAPVRRQLSAAVVAACQRHRHGLDRSTLPEAARPYNALLVVLETASTVSGLRLWNYNKNAADTARGVKRMVALADGAEVSPPGGLLIRRAPGTAAFDFGQFIPLSTCWAAAGSRAAGRQRTTMQHGQPVGQAVGITGAGSSPQRQQQQHQLVIQSESVAWACNMPDPAAALEYLQRAAALSKAASPGGPLQQQPGENFGTPLPCGFSLRLVLLTTWGCPHYIGLSGVEVRDAVRGSLRIRPEQVHAVPSSVSLLPGMAADVRTPDKLVDGVTSGAAQHSWLAPLDPQEGNSVLVVLDAPLLLGSIRVWNYAKTPSRGVQELECYLDEQLVWKGLLQRAPEALAPGEDFSQVLCFSEEAVQEAAAAARRRVVVRRPFAGLAARRQSATGSLAGVPLGTEGVEEWCQRQEAVVLVNNGQFVAFPPDGSASPMTARPATAVTTAT